MTKYMAAVLLLVAAMSAQNAPSTNKGSHLDIPAISREAHGAVVSIVVSDRNGHPVAQGSGFLISKDGQVVTNYHVIKSGSSAIIKLPDGAFFVVDGLLASDKDRDVAIIKAHGNDFKVLTLGDSDRLQVGEEVVAIGNPLSLESTVSNGIVSGIRTVEEEGGKFLQITAPISPGSSGGPLFNMSGKVIGITTSHLRNGENLNFAIPINDVKPILAARLSKSRALPDEVEAVAEAPEPKPQATLAQQKACADQARTKFSEDGYTLPHHNTDGTTSPPGSYTSHYDAQTNVCYIWVISLTQGKNSSLLANYRVYDVFEGKVYGVMTIAMYSGSPSLIGTTNDPSWCRVMPVGQQPIQCSTESEDEFDALIKKYFGMER